MESLNHLAIEPFSHYLSKATSFLTVWTRDSGIRTRLTLPDKRVSLPRQSHRRQAPDRRLNGIPPHTAVCVFLLRSRVVEAWRKYSLAGHFDLPFQILAYGSLLRLGKNCGSAG